MHERLLVNVDQVQRELGRTLEEIDAGPALIRYKYGLFGRSGKVVPPELMIDEDTGDLRLEYSLVYPPPTRDTKPVIKIAIGVNRSAETREHVVYIDSDGERVFQANPTEEDVIEKVHQALIDDAKRRENEQRLPRDVRNRVQEAA